MDRLDSSSSCLTSVSYRPVNALSVMMLVVDAEGSRDDKDEETLLSSMEVNSFSGSSAAVDNFSVLSVAVDCVGLGSGDHEDDRELLPGEYKRDVVVGPLSWISPVDLTAVHWVLPCSSDTAA